MRFSSWNGRINAPEIDYREAAATAADRFEAEGWEVLRTIPDLESPISLEWRVEAIRGDEKVVATYAEMCGRASRCRQ